MKKTQLFIGTRAGLGTTEEIPLVLLEVGEDAIVFLDEEDLAVYQIKTIEVEIQDRQTMVHFVKLVNVWHRNMIPRSILNIIQMNAQGTFQSTC